MPGSPTRLLGDGCAVRGVNREIGRHFGFDLTFAFRVGVVGGSFRRVGSYRLDGVILFAGREREEHQSRKRE